MSPSSGDFDDDELWNFASRKSRESNVSGPGPLPWKRSRKDDTAPPDTRRQIQQSAPWKQSEGHRPIVDDVASIELRHQTLAPTRLSDPSASHSDPAWHLGVKCGLAVVFVIAIGVVGSEFDSDLPSPLPLPASHSNPLDQPGLTSEQRQRPVESAAVTISAPRGLDARTVATKMKIGVELMTYGEVTKARVMFQRVAEAGQGVGAFALAETYDPIVLKGLRLREEIMPNLALAHAWYERARDLGSPDAQDRISRLALLPR